MILILGDIDQARTPAEMALEDPDKGKRMGKTERLVLMSRTMRRQYTAKVLEGFREAFQALPVEPERWEIADREMKAIEKKIDADKSPGNAVFAAAFPVLKPGDFQGTLYARRNLLLTSLRLLSERNKTGKFPVKLPDGGKTSQDPFRHRPLAYVPNGVEGFLLYSVGPDLVDDGGVPKTKDRATGDLRVQVRFR